MKILKSGVAVLLVLLMVFVSISGCEKKELPITTSSELNIYLNGDELVTSDGDAIDDGFALDKEGNIVDAEGKIVVAEANVVAFSYATAIKLEQDPIIYTLKASELSDGQILTRPASFDLEIALTPSNLVNTKISIESNDPGAIYFPYDMNVSILPESVLQPSDNILPSIDLVADNTGKIKVVVVAAFDGAHELSVKNVIGEEIGQIQINVLAEIKETNEEDNGQDKRNETATDCEHDFRVETIEPSVHTQGYTLYTCKKCGYSYRSDYVPKLTCNHEWEQTRVVNATYTTKGYTLYTCKLCGKTEKRNEVPVLVCDHTNMRETVVAPTCTRDGYTLHECMTCKIYNYREDTVPKLGHAWDAGTISTQPGCEKEGVITYHCTREGCAKTMTDSVPATGHTWDSGMITKDPSCSETGTITYACKKCGVFKTESIPMTDHQMTDEVIEPTYTSQGYTRHYCTVCGYEAPKTDYTPEAPHQHQAVWTTISNPSCKNAGSREARCSICGAFMSSEEIPATGNHNYIEETVNADCEHNGYVLHTCTYCGDSYQDQSIPALGHDWVAHTETKKVGSECHTICAECGMDLTANGISGDAVSDHVKAHVMAGGGSRTYQTYVDVYDNVTSYTCSRCGKTQ